MHFSRFSIKNYKSFSDSDSIDLGKGINLIVGQNNAGKTALLEAMSLTAAQNPHRSLLSVPHRNFVQDPAYNAEYQITMSGLDLLRAVEQCKDPILFIIPNEYMNTPEQMTFPDYILRFLHSNDIETTITFQAPPPYAFKILHENFSFYPSHLNSIRGDAGSHQFYLREGVFGQVAFANKFTHSQTQTSFNYKIDDRFREKIYRFKAERMNISRFQFGNSQTLDADASNLATVLNNLKSMNDALFGDFMELVQYVLPQVKSIGFRSAPGRPQELEIMIWAHDGSSRREDLAVPLSECGTGISQVLAILYVVITADDSKVLLIDEPQSFLHPGAARKLLSTFSKYSQHQYIISTHSTSLIGYVDPDKVISIRYDEESYQSKAYSINKDEASELRFLLQDVGSSLSETFGADSILWVEGKTEALCFPLLLSEICKVILGGVQIVSIVNTGDLEAKKAKLVFEIYRNLSTGSSVLLPPSIGFLLDKEGKNQKDIEDLERLGATFIDRAMYENYLLHAGALSHLANSESFRTSTVEENEVKDWLKTVQGDQNLIIRDLKEEDWIQAVHGTKVLDKFFESFSDDKRQYSERKPEYALKLTRWMIDNSPKSFQDLTDLLKELVLKSPSALNIEREI